MSKFKEQLKEHLKKISLKGDKILSIGGQNDDKSYFANVECDEFVVLDSNREFNPQILFDLNRSMQGEASFEVDEKYMENFDIVLALNIWEYIYAPMTAVQNVVDLLRPGGRLITNFPFVYPVHRPEGTDFLRYTPEGVEKILKMAGLKIVSHDFILGDELLLEYYQADGLKARPGFDHRVIGSIVEATKG